ncbi:uncharacterized protein LOC144623575 [Crassostrea virginica]
MVAILNLDPCLRFIAKCSSFATENLSRRKTTIITQSSTYNVNNATLANDGMDATTELKCAHTAANHSKAWLQVDLGTPFRIRNVVIYYRKEGDGSNDWKQYRFRQFYLDVSDLPVTQTTTAERTRCYTDNTTAPNLPPNIIDIPCKQTARFVIVETTYDAPEDDPQKGAVLEICEIQVKGCGCTKTSGVCTSCMDGWYGYTCDETCAAGCSLRCDQVDGNCSCKPGWGGYDCRECSPFFYGESCKEPCSTDCVQGICFGNNGSCIKGRSLENSKREFTQYLMYVFAGLFGINLSLNIFLTMRAKTCKQETEESTNMEENQYQQIELADLNPVAVEIAEGEPVYENIRETRDVCEMPHYETLKYSA